MGKGITFNAKFSNSDDELEKAELIQDTPVSATRSKYEAPTSLIVTIGWLVFWFTQNTAITFLNKKAMSPVKLPTTVRQRRGVYLVCLWMSTKSHIASG